MSRYISLINITPSDFPLEKPSLVDLQKHFIYIGIFSRGSHFASFSYICFNINHDKTMKKKLRHPPTVYLNFFSARLLIHSANPQSRPEVTSIFTHVRPSPLSKIAQNKTIFMWEWRSLLEGLWVWLSGSLTTPVL